MGREICSNIELNRIWLWIIFGREWKLDNLRWVNRLVKNSSPAKAQINKLKKNIRVKERFMTINIEYKKINFLRKTLEDVKEFSTLFHCVA